jgi:hypothetical protein
MAAKQEETMAQSQESEGVKLGNEILAGKQVSPSELLDLVKKKLKKERAFGQLAHDDFVLEAVVFYGPTR